MSASARAARTHYAAKVNAALRNQFGGHAVKMVRQEVTGTDRAGHGARPTRSSRGSSACRSTRRRSSSSARPATWRKRKLLPAIYNLAHEGALPERFNLIGVSRSDDARRRRSAPMAAEAITRVLAPRAPTRRCCDALLDARPLRRRDVRRRRRSTRRSTTTLDEFDARRRPAAQPRLLPVDGAAVLPGHRRGARRAQSLNRHDERRGARRSSRSRSGRRSPRPSELNQRGARRCSTSARSSASTTTWARRRSRTCWRSGSPTACSSRCGTATTSTTSRSRRPRTSASARAPATTTRAGALRDLVQNHMLQLLTLLCDGAAGRVHRRRGARREGQGPARDPRARPGARSTRWRCARQYAPGRRRRRARGGLPRGGRRAAGLQHRDLRGAAPGDRQLALGRRAVLPAHRQAAGAQGDRDRGHAQAGPAPGVQPGGLGRRAAQPARPDDAAQRGRVAARSGRRSPARGCGSAR